MGKIKAVFDFLKLMRITQKYEKKGRLFRSIGILAGITAGILVI